MTRSVPNSPPLSYRSILLVLALLACAGALYYGYPHFESFMTGLLEWANGLGPWAPIAFMGIVIVAIVFLVPGLLLSLGAGFMFGVVKGVICMWIATNIGAAIAFFIGRYFMGERFAHYLQHHEKIQHLDAALQHEGWKVVMLTRMVPFFPFKLSNYVFGFVGFSLWHFCLGTAIGIVPITVLNVYTGSLAGDLATLSHSDVTRTPQEWAFSIGMFLIAAPLFIYVTSVARKALRARNSLHLLAIYVLPLASVGPLFLFGSHRF